MSGITKFVQLAMWLATLFMALVSFRAEQGLVHLRCAEGRT